MTPYDAYTILYVDDENANRVVIKHNLGKRFTVLLADSGPAALELLQQHSVAVLLTDQRMPGMSGVDLAEQVLQRHPEVVRVIITAYSDLEATIDAINRAQVNRFIKKPWTREELVAVMEDSIRAYHHGRLLDGMQQRLFQLDRITSVAVMSSAIAHDLRQPLAYIEPMLGSLKHDTVKLDELKLAANAKKLVGSIAEGLDDIDYGVQKFKLIAETLLSTLREQKVKRELVDLRQVVEAAVALTRTTIMEVAELELDLPAGTEPLLARTAEGPLVQLLVNLLLNAAQAIPKADGQRVALRLRADGERFLLVVEDTGCGMDPELQKEIFTPFFTTKGAAGTGLGLAICKQLVEELEGTIAVDSTLGQGSRFLIELPIDPGTEQEAKPA